MAISVVVAVDPVGDELVDRISKRMSTITVGDGRSAGSDMGPLVTGAHRDRVASYVDSAEREGASLV
ncbi:aldehyde dehydrogenase family protein, partial [Enterococcus faecium]